jgi:hypothetical protein
MLITVVREKDELKLNYMLQSGGVMPKWEESTDKGDLRTLTQLILDFSEVRWILACIYVPSQHAHSRKFYLHSQKLLWTNSPPM